jgi:hypothetical protein
MHPMPDARLNDSAATEQADDTSAAICPCGATSRHATAPDRCARGHVLIGNAAARKHGVRAFETQGPASLPSDLRLTVDDFRAQVVRERGGDELTAIEGGYIRRLVELETIARLLASDLASRGVFTQRGRVRGTFSKWLATLDRWDRFAQRIGTDARTPTLTLSQRLSVAPVDNQGSDERPEADAIDEHKERDDEPDL